MIKLPIHIITPSNLNQPYHPSVLFFEKGFAGYKYWMVESPYPVLPILPYRDRWETPCIHFSNDGKNWNSIKNNPIDDLTELQIENKCYFSDPHLVFVNNYIECWYRLTEFDSEGITKTKILRKCTNDGVSWTDRELMINLSNNKILGEIIISPAITYIDGMYCMWYVDKSSKEKDRNICYAHSKDGFNWEQHSICSLKGYYSDPWHIDVQYINNNYLLLIYGNDKITLWKGDIPDKFSFEKEILKPSNKPNSFYSKGLYRACLVEDKTSYKIYFSAHNGICSNIGLMQSKKNFDFKVVNGGTVLDAVCAFCFLHFSRIKRKIKKS